MKNGTFAYSFIFSFLLISIALIQIFVALGLLILMITLLLAIPFGTIIYLIIYGSFNRAGADIALSIIMLLKLSFAVSLFFAQQCFLQSKGLVLLILTSLLATVLATFLLGIVPGFLASITDAIAAIIVVSSPSSGALFCSLAPSYLLSRLSVLIGPSRLDDSAGPHVGR